LGSSKKCLEGSSLVKIGQKQQAYILTALVINDTVIVMVSDVSSVVTKITGVHCLCGYMNVPEGLWSVCHVQQTDAVSFVMCVCVCVVVM
jgi:hypothetical protein